MRERPSLPADVTVSELLYMLAIRAPRQGERREGRKEGDEWRMTEDKRRGERGRWIEGEKSGNKRKGVKGRKAVRGCGKRRRRRRARWQHINGL